MINNVLKPFAVFNLRSFGFARPNDIVGQANHYQQMNINMLQNKKI